MSTRAIREWLAGRREAEGRPGRQAGGVRREWVPGMGWVTTVPADPCPRGIDLGAGAAGWEPWPGYRRRLMGRG
jgi:hypothetical protein